MPQTVSHYSVALTKHVDGVSTQMAVIGDFVALHYAIRS